MDYNYNKSTINLSILGQPFWDFYDKACLLFWLLEKSCNKRLWTTNLV